MLKINHHRSFLRSSHGLVYITHTDIPKDTIIMIMRLILLLHHLRHFKKGFTLLAWTMSHQECPGYNDSRKLSRTGISAQILTSSPHWGRLAQPMAPMKITTVLAKPWHSLESRREGKELQHGESLAVWTWAMSCCWMPGLDKGLQPVVFIEWI